MNLGANVIGSCCECRLVQTSVVLNLGEYSWKGDKQRRVFC